MMKQGDNSCGFSKVLCSFLFLGVEVDRHDETVETQDLGEDEDEDHADKESGLLGCASHPGVSHHAYVTGYSIIWVTGYSIN